MPQEKNKGEEGQRLPNKLCVSLIAKGIVADILCLEIEVLKKMTNEICNSTLNKRPTGIQGFKG